MEVTEQRTPITMVRMRISQRKLTGGLRLTIPSSATAGGRRGTCMVSEKAAVEAGAVTPGAVRNAWLGGILVDSVTTA